MGVVELNSLTSILFCLTKLINFGAFVFKRVMRSVDNVFVGGGGGETVVFDFLWCFLFLFDFWHVHYMQMSQLHPCPL